MALRYQGPGREKNGNQGTQRQTTGKSQAAGAYSRSGQRAAPTGNTPFANSWAEDLDARDKRHKSGKYSKQTLFP